MTNGGMKKMKQQEVPVLWRWLALAAVLSFIPSIFFPYVGEEAVYTITTLEMWYRHFWSNTLLYGNDYGRPPFLNWVMLPLAMTLGASNILVASRLVTAFATVGTALALFWTARGLGATGRQAWVAVLVFLSSDALLYHGWLAYSDPLFALLTFGATACIMLAARQQRTILLFAAAALVTAAFLTKALTAYVFVATAWLAVYVRHPEARATLLKPSAILAYALGLAAALAWFHFNSTAGFAGHQGGAMTGDILRKLLPTSARDWVKQIVEFPLELFLRFLPVSAIIIYGLVRDRSASESDAGAWNATVGCIALVDFLPYWLSPQSGIRYLLPIYPLIAYYLASKLVRFNEASVRAATYAIAGVIALKYIGLGLFPMYQAKYRGSAQAVAKEFVSVAGTAPIYSDDSSSAGLSVVGNIDTLRWPLAPVTWPVGHAPDGWIVTRDPDKPYAEISKVAMLGKERIFLVCSGRACDTEAIKR
jgi:4-amino-4-deoxy-L-arabinose transferase-like glycosyltransferase